MCFPYDILLSVTELDGHVASREVQSRAVREHSLGCSHGYERRDAQRQGSDRTGAGQSCAGNNGGPAITSRRLNSGSRRSPLGTGMMEPEIISSSLRGGTADQ